MKFFLISELLIGGLGFAGGSAFMAFESAADFFIPLAIISVFVAAVAQAPVRKATRDFLVSQNYDRYVREHPNCAPKGENGRLKCFKCRGDRIGTHRLMQRSYLMYHFCNQCGTRLYYSPEQG